MAQRGLTKADLQRLTGIPYHRLNPWFIRDNAKPNATDVEAVAAGLQVPISHLLNGAPIESQGAREWLLATYDKLSPSGREQLEAFVRFLAEQNRKSQDSEPGTPPEGPAGT